MATGIMVTGPNGSKYWFPCGDKDAGRVLSAHADGLHARVLGDPGTRAEFGTTDDGGEFKPGRVLLEGKGGTDRPHPRPPA